MQSPQSQKEVRESLEDSVDLDVWERRLGEATRRNFQKRFASGQMVRMSGSSIIKLNEPRSSSS